MRLRVNNVADWALLKPGKLRLRGAANRTVDIQFNVTHRTILRLVRSKPERISLLGVLEPGMTSVTFPAEGDVDIVHESEGEVWFLNPYRNNKRRENPEAVSFTKPMDRDPRDPEMERMMQLMEARVVNRVRLENARERELLRQREARLAAEQAEAAAAANADPETGVIDDGADGASEAGGSATSPVEDANSGGTGGVQTPPAAGPETGTETPPAPEKAS